VPPRAPTTKNVSNLRHDATINFMVYRGH